MARHWGEMGDNVTAMRAQYEASKPAPTAETAEQQANQADDAATTGIAQTLFMPGGAGAGVYNLGKSIGSYGQSILTRHDAEDQAKQTEAAQEAAAKLLDIERAKREKEAWVNRIIRSQ